MAAFFFFYSISSEYQVQTGLLPCFGPVTVTNDRLIGKGLAGKGYFGQSGEGLTGFPQCQGKVRIRAGAGPRSASVGMTVWFLLRDLVLF